MYVDHIRLKNFRNYKTLEFKPGAGLNILIGKNAQGKTNFLEALNILASSKSFRIKSESELINWQADWAEIDASISTNDGTKKRLTVRWAYNPATKALDRRILINDNVIKRLSDFLGELPLALFVPADLALIQGGPMLRRRLLDVLLCKISASYCSSLINYRQILRQRNKFLHHVNLKDCTLKSKSSSGDRSYLNVCNEKLVKFGSEVICQRLAILAYLQIVVRQIYAQLANDSDCQFNLIYQSRLGRTALTETNESLACRAAECLNNNSGIDLQSSLEYLPLIEELFRESLQKTSASEYTFKSTQTGPHRDDFAIEVLQYSLKTFGSQGQHRSAALALRLAEAKIMGLAGKEESVILLDDCFSELDKGRQEILLSYLESLGQVFLTAAISTEFSALFSGSRRADCFEVEDGNIKTLSGGG
ncbi:MAG: DNA replication/repair protein RecF [Candidatus Bruticola sp.]